MKTCLFAILLLAIGVSCKANLGGLSGSSSSGSSAASSPTASGSEEQQELARFESLLEETCQHDIDVVVEPSDTIEADKMARWCKDALAGANSGTKCETTADDHCQKAGVCGDEHGRAAFARLSRIVCRHDASLDGVEPVLATKGSDLLIQFPTISGSIYSVVHDYTNRKLPAAADPNLDGEARLSEKRSWAFALAKLEKFKKLTEDACGRKLDIDIDYEAFRDAGHDIASTGWGCQAIVRGTTWVCKGSKRSAFNKRVDSIRCVPHPASATDPHLASFKLKSGVLEASYAPKGANLTTDTNEWLDRNL